jgi:hypothetical protein
LVTHLCGTGVEFFGGVDFFIRKYVHMYDMYKIAEKKKILGRRVICNLTLTQQEMADSMIASMMNAYQQAREVGHDNMIELITFFQEYVNQCHPRETPEGFDEDDEANYRDDGVPLICLPQPVGKVNTDNCYKFVWETRIYGVDGADGGRAYNALYFGTDKFSKENEAVHEKFEHFNTWWVGQFTDEEEEEGMVACKISPAREASTDFGLVSAKKQKTV